MPVVRIRGIQMNYDVLGDTGSWVALAPGGRRGMEGIHVVDAQAVYPFLARRGVGLAPGIGLVGGELGEAGLFARVGGVIMSTEEKLDSGAVARSIYPLPLLAGLIPGEHNPRRDDSDNGTLTHEAESMPQIAILPRFLIDHSKYQVRFIF